jgi:hypothetical protein
MASKNLMAKSRKPGNAYVVINDGGWSWEILKMYKSVDASAADGYARAFCFVKSPFVPNGEYGDTYLHEIGMSGKAAVIAALKKAELALAAKVAS